MSTCPSCASEVPEGNRFCGSCGFAFDTPTSAPTETSLKSEPATPSHPSPDENRFVPGTVLARRYRIISLLGRGGMGEVYRADDLKLGQPVALKFLPPAIQRDAGRLERFLNEVKVALKVTHPNVCRVHDLGEAEGQHYISMEYVDGEDLASLLRRIGRLPRDKAVQIARQLCAGLAAAQEQGILHRDLKPANVMIDGRGRAKIADFGLAGLAEGIEGNEVRAGTPAYMSPEQLAGREVTARSDVYSLGLVLYELFTGRRAFEATTPAEIARRHEESTPTSPSIHVEGLDPAVERIILRCLEPEPSERPPSALAVAVALPGGDPLAAALAAGETPPPELVADAGKAGGLKPWVAWSCLLVCIVGSLLAVQFAEPFHVVTPGKAPQLLAERAREIAGALGYDRPPLDSAYGYEANRPFLEHLTATDGSSGWRERLAAGQPPGLLFWYRQSPRYLARLSGGRVLVVSDDPPADAPGMLEVRLDLVGRLRGFRALPPERVDSAAVGPEPDWSTLFDAAGFPEDAFRTVEPRWPPRVFADRSAAWEGSYPDDPATAIRVEAAAYRGRPVSFRIVEPWTPAASVETSRRSFADRLLQGSLSVFVVGTLLGGALIARRNLRLGRGDRKGAWRFAFYLFFVRMLVWFFGANEQLEPSGLSVFISHLAQALYRFAAVWLFYIAAEPYLRRIWPKSMVSWVRLLRGRIDDPLVGRDLLIGILGAVTLMLATPIVMLAGGWLGWPPSSVVPSTTMLETLRGSPQALAMMLYEHAARLLHQGLYLIVFLVLMRLLLRRTWLAVTAFLLIIALLGPATEGISGAVGWSILALWTTAWLLIFFRAGLLSLLVALGTLGLWDPLAHSLDPANWYSTATYIALLMTLGTATYGFYVSLAGRPVLGDALLDNPDGNHA